MKSKLRIILAAFLFMFFVAQTTQAALVICGRSGNGEGSTACTPGLLMNGVIKVLNYLIDSATLLAIGYVLFAGVSMILARGNPAKFETAKSTMSNAVQGLIIVLAAYMIVNFAIATLTGGKTFDQIFNFLPKSST